MHVHTNSQTGVTTCSNLLLQATNSRDFVPPISAAVFLKSD